MRAFVFSFVFSIYLFAQSHESSRLFAIPKEMDKTWPDAVLGDSEEKLLEESVAPDLRGLEQNCEEKPKFESLRKTSIALGKLGQGVLVATSSRCSCGGTGNCPIYLYVRDKDRYREVLGNGKRVPYSWAFAVVDSEADIPDIVLATHSSARQVRLAKYRYVGERFAQLSCETLTAKSAGSVPRSWWDPNEVIVRPCERQ